MTDFYVSITPQEAAQIINRYIVNGSITGVLIDEYVNDNSTGKAVIVQVYEKHYYRAGNRLTLTVVIDNIDENTHIHVIGGGGGQGFFRFDWGASDSFEACAYNALYEYVIK
jgi:hypothetical protein